MYRATQQRGGGEEDPLPSFNDDSPSKRHASSSSSSLLFSLFLWPQTLSRLFRATETRFLIVIVFSALAVFRISFLIMSGGSTWLPDHGPSITRLPARADYSKAMAQPDTDAIKEWSKFPSGMDDLTKETQELIYQHQNPPNCSDVRYFVWKNHDFGMGSDLHTIGWALGHALAHNRVLVYHYHQWIYTDSSSCMGQQSPDCFFRPLSHCQNFVSSMDIMLSLPYDPVKPDRFGNVLVTERILRLECRLEHAITQTFIPPFPGWRERGVPWWRAQTTRYILTPNKSLQKWARAIMIHDLVQYPRYPGFSPLTHPPPDKAICIHIRHGDKAKEMTLHNLQDYMTGADDLVKMYGAEPHIFITTDDEHVIDEIEGGDFDYMGFTFYYIKYPRMNHLNPMETADMLGRTHFARLSLANLYLGVHPSCQWFVETTASNWNRLINEIRLTDGQRAGAPMVDLEVGEW